MAKPHDRRLSTHAPPPPARLYGVIALAGVLWFVMVAIGVQVSRADLRWQDAPLSFYLLGAYGHWLQAAYFVLAAALFALGAGYYRALRGGQRSAAPWLLFGGAGLGLCATALAHSNLPGHAPTLQGFVHGVAAQAAFLCVTVAMLLQSWWLRRDPRWRARFAVAFALAGSCFVALWLDVWWRGMPRGLAQRLVIALILAWLLLAANWLRKPPHAPSP